MSKDTLKGELIRGHIDTIILKSLFQGDRYGYDIIKEIEQKTDGEYKIKQPTLYSCLKRLEEQGFTSSYWGTKDKGGRKKYYSLTSMGKEVFIKNQNDWQRSKEIIDILVESNDEPTLDTQAVDEDLNKSDEPKTTAPILNTNNEATHKFKQQKHYDNFFAGPQKNKNEIFIPQQDDSLYKDESFKRFDFVHSTYELDSDGETIKEINPAEINDLQGDEPEHNEKDKIFAENKLDTKTDDSPSLESYYFEQKLKPSYIDDVSNLDYQPKEKEAVNTWDYDDEPTYEELLKNEYGENEEENVSDVNELPYEEQKETDDTVELYTIKAEEEKVNESFSQFFKYDSSSLNKLEDTEIISREYHSALSRLIRQQKPKYSQDPYLQNKLEKTAESAKQMGDDVIIRRHTDTVKEYNSQNYYYSNRLRLAHYAIMFMIMLLESAVSFFVFEVYMHGTIITQIDLWIYIAGIVISLLLPIIAFTLSSADYSKRKKLDFDFKSSVVFRLMLFMLFVVIVFSINAYLGIISNDFTDYLASLVYPIIMLSNVLISSFVFYALYKSNRFRCQ